KIALHQKNQENSFTENDSESESFSKHLMQEHKLQTDFRNNVNAVKVPDAPNEAFPFFGGMTDSTQTNGYTGTRAFYN
ncbi:MAG: hypothetical protein MJ201_05630, partial [Mycoplasmoidaceae bacterium]|nr:hypothetical protein [Mycoplasmoidaceae bacterium]